LPRGQLEGKITMIWTDQKCDCGKKICVKDERSPTSHVTACCAGCEHIKDKKLKKPDPSRSNESTCYVSEALKKLRGYATTGIMKDEPGMEFAEVRKKIDTWINTIESALSEDI
jgi:hypothetical protein